MTKPHRRQHDPISPARQALFEVVRDAAARWPDMAGDVSRFDQLDARDRGLAMAVHRVVMSRWLTIRHVLDQYLKQPFVQLEPAMQAVLATATGQLLFFDRLPAYAVVDEAVQLARKHIRRGASKLTNAVLRRVAELEPRSIEGPWQPAQDCLPVEGGCLKVERDVLPAIGRRAEHLCVATSMPRKLYDTWAQSFDSERAEGLCMAGLRHAPIIVATEVGFEPAVGETEKLMTSHERPGWFCWQGSVGELRAFLADHPARRVQDPAAAMPVAATGELSPRRIIDWCAGRGTKTRQLAVLHPAAQVIGSDTDSERLATLEREVGRLGNVEAVGSQRLAGPEIEPADLIVLDVPCSNTAVLSRRPEARYRYSSKSMQSLVQLQQQIIQQAVLKLADGGHLLYATCSLLAEENQQQVRWMAERFGLKVVHEHMELPRGSGAGYQDGSYHALLAKG